MTVPLPRPAPMRPGIKRIRADQLRPGMVALVGHRYREVERTGRADVDRAGVTRDVIVLAGGRGYVLAPGTIVRTRRPRSTPA